ADSAVMLQEIRKHGMRVHRHMPVNVMENVGFRRVLQRFPVADISRRWKHPRRQHLEKCFLRQETTHRRRAPTGPRAKSRRDVRQIGQTIAAQPYYFVAFEIFAATMRLNLRGATSYQFRPYRMVL